MSLYYAATFSHEHRHHSKKPHHTLFVFCIKRRVFLVPLITFFPSGLNLAQRGFHVLTTSVNGEGFLYMQFKTNYRVLHMYVDKSCVIIIGKLGPGNKENVLVYWYGFFLP